MLQSCYPNSLQKNGRVRKLRRPFRLLLYGVACNETEGEFSSIVGFNASISRASAHRNVSPSEHVFSNQGIQVRPWRNLIDSSQRSHFGATNRRLAMVITTAPT